MSARRRQKPSVSRACAPCAVYLTKIKSVSMTCCNSFVSVVSGRRAPGGEDRRVGEVCGAVWSGSGSHDGLEFGGESGGVFVAGERCEADVALEAVDDRGGTVHQPPGVDVVGEGLDEAGRVE